MEWQQPVSNKKKGKGLRISHHLREVQTEILKIEEQPGPHHQILERECR